VSDERAELAANITDALPAILTVDEAAAFLRISRRTLGKLLAAKRIRTVRYTSGGSARVLIRRAALTAFVANNGE
jgi:excisionase family DNA binding protein